MRSLSTRTTDIQRRPHAVIRTQAQLVVVTAPGSHSCQSSMSRVEALPVRQEFAQGGYYILNWNGDPSVRVDGATWSMVKQLYCR